MHVIAPNPTLEVYTTLERLDFLQLQRLMELTAPWARGRQIEDLERAVAASDPVVHLWDGDFLVAFGRATSDGVYRAMLFDVIVHPRYQGQGIGRQLVGHLLSHPKLASVEKVFLVTTDQKGFYERLGFTENTASTMVLVQA